MNELEEILQNHFNASHAGSRPRGHYTATVRVSVIKDSVVPRYVHYAEPGLWEDERQLVCNECGDELI